MATNFSLRRRLQFRIGTLLLLAALVAVACRAWPIYHDWNLSPHESMRRAIEACERQIDRELATHDRNALPPDHWAREWSGVYEGNTLSCHGQYESFHVFRDGNIAFSYGDCWNNFNGGNVGQIVDCSTDGFTIKWDFDPMELQPDIRTQMYFVRWGPRRYLLNGYAIYRFASLYNAGGKHRASLANVLSQRDELESPYADYKNPPTCKPQLPARFTHLIIEEPTELVIRQMTFSENGEERFGRITANVELEGGTDRGLVDGLEIPLPDADFDAWIELTEVRENSASGTLTGWKRERSTPLPEPGCELFLPGTAAEYEPEIAPDLAADTDE